MNGHEFGSRLRQWGEMLFGDQPDAVLIHQHGRVAHGNGELGVLLGIDGRTMYGRPVLELYSEQDYPLAQARMQRAAFSAWPTPTTRHCIPRPDGGAVEVEIATRMVPIEGREPVVVEVLRRIPEKGGGAWS